MRKWFLGKFPLSHETSYHNNHNFNNTLVNCIETATALVCNIQLGPIKTNAYGLGQTYFLPRSILDYITTTGLFLYLCPCCRASIKSPKKLLGYAQDSRSENYIIVERIEKFRHSLLSPKRVWESIHFFTLSTTIQFSDLQSCANPNNFF